MRFAELAFLALLVLYHGFLLAPRHRRPFPANYLVFLAGMALCWNLGLEGLRWQTLPPTLLLLIDLAVLFPTFATLRGRLPRSGFWSTLVQILRSTVASIAFLLAVGAGLLAVAFPLPRVELTGGLPPSYRTVRFPASTERPAMEVRLWYPSSGDLRTRPRPAGEPETWQRIRAEGGPPAFWQSYLEHLPSNLVRGGKTAAEGTRYPVIYAAVPRGEDAGEFGYLFEDLASRGFVVASAVPLPTAQQPPARFEWATAIAEILRPFSQPELWLEPDLSSGQAQGPTDYRWVAAAQDAVKQLDAEPGDLLFSSVDWSRQGLWAWGESALTRPEQKALGLQGVLHAGGTVPEAHLNADLELWIVGGAGPAKGRPGQWFLTLPQLHRADLSDAAYLKPLLVFFGLKARADSGLHGALRQYQAAFFQFAFWSSSGGTSFRQTVPEVPGLILSGE